MSTMSMTAATRTLPATGAPAFPIAPRAPSRLPACVSVRSEQDMVDAVLAASREGTTVRAMGARGSKNGCYSTDGISLDISGYDRILRVDGHRVTVEGGITIGALTAALSERGLTLPTPGEWGGATVAGALSTGTHGGSLRHGIVASSVRSLCLVTAEGRCVELRSGSDLFAHAGVSMGGLGLISTVTLECVPNFFLEMRGRPMTLGWFLEDHRQMLRENEFVSAIWIPTSGRVVTYLANRVDRPRSIVPRPKRFSPHAVLAAALSRHLDWNVVGDRLFSGVWVDEGRNILAPIRRSPHRVPLLGQLTRRVAEIEFAVPLQGSEDVLRRLDRLLARYPRALRNPVGLRTTAADDFTLSPCQGRDTLWIALFLSRDGRRPLAADLRAFFCEHGARCHWGKNLGLTPDQLSRRYEGWEDFRDARRTFDPDRIFDNAFLQRLGL